MHSKKFSQICRDYDFSKSLNFLIFHVLLFILILEASIITEITINFVKISRLSSIDSEFQTRRIRSSSH